MLFPKATQVISHDIRVLLPFSCNNPRSSHYNNVGHRIEPNNQDYCDLVLLAAKMY